MSFKNGLMEKKKIFFLKTPPKAWKKAQNMKEIFRFFELY